MKKHKAKITKKTNSKTIVLVVILALVAAFGIYLKSLLVSPQVAEIAAPNTTYCQTNVNTISFHDECATAGTFKRAVYTCKNGSTAEKLASNECMSYEKIMAEAQNNCGQTCVAPSPAPTCVPNPCAEGRECKLMALPDGQSYCPVRSAEPRPSPYPSCVPNPCTDGRVCKLMALPEGQSYCPVSSIPPRPSPTPTSTPSPSLRPSPTPTATAISSAFQCRLVAYKLFPNDVVSDPTAFVTPDRLLDPATARVVAGDRIAYLVEASHNRDIPLDVRFSIMTSENAQGFNEPITILKTTPNCKPESQNKYFGCDWIAQTINPKVPSMVKAGAVIEITPDIEKYGMTSTKVGVHWSLGGVGYQSHCALTLLGAKSYPPSTVTPRPTLAPGCYEAESWCLQSIIGRECPSKVVCPSKAPSSTPVPTAVATSVPTAMPTTTAQETSIPVTTPTYCPASLGSWAYKTSCGNGQYRYVEFSCIGDKTTRTLGSSSSCKSESVWTTEAREACRTSSCSTTNPSATVKPVPSPTVRPSLISCYRTCRQTQGRVNWTCLRKCYR